MVKFELKKGYMMKFPKIHHLMAIGLMFQTSSALYGARGDEREKIGNYLLPTSQQPLPLYGFGQNIVDKHDLQFLLYLNQKGGKQVNFTDIMPSILYGIRDDLSLFIILPFTPKYKTNSDTSSGIEDTILQLEYAFFSKKTFKSNTQATIVGNIGLPTGSSKKVPHTGFGAPSFFLGLTLSHSERYWYAWIQGGTTLTLQRHETKFGNQFYYQGGFEGVITTRPGWLFAWMVELFGLYEQKDKICGKQDHDSGGNTFYIGPSLWASSEKLIFQLGLAFPAAQHLFGEQPNVRYFLATNFGYKFN